MKKETVKILVTAKIEYNANDPDSRTEAIQKACENAVGIKMDLLNKVPKIKPLVAMLIQSEVFLEDSLNKVLILNSSSEMAQKVLIFLKLGLNNSEHGGDLKLQLEAIT